MHRSINSVSSAIAIGAALVAEPAPAPPTYDLSQIKLPAQPDVLTKPSLEIPPAQTAGLLIPPRLRLLINVQKVATA